MLFGHDPKFPIYSDDFGDTSEWMYRAMEVLKGAEATEEEREELAQWVRDAFMEGSNAYGFMQSAEHEMDLMADDNELYKQLAHYRKRMMEAESNTATSGQLYRKEIGALKGKLTRATKKLAEKDAVELRLEQANAILEHMGQPPV